MTFERALRRRPCSYRASQQAKIPRKAVHPLEDACKMVGLSFVRDVTMQLLLEAAKLTSHPLPGSAGWAAVLPSRASLIPTSPRKVLVNYSLSPRLTDPSLNNSIVISYTTPTSRQATAIHRHDPHHRDVDILYQRCPRLRAKPVGARMQNPTYTPGTLLFDRDPSVRGVFAVVTSLMDSPGSPIPITPKGSTHNGRRN
ncbi:hypothetical protein EDB80DRAFT_842537 [Ilyonectria destructans]|nr:hypothetical protein EDB80DRAFT_842537 [Ilyonectria destructans]